MLKLKGFLSSGLRAGLGSFISPTIPVLCPTRKFVLGMASPESSTFKEENESLPDKVKVIFLLGGPGSGKGTQSALIVKHEGFVHLSAGDLLQAEIESGSEDGKMIHEFKKEGQIVPSEITVRLLQQAMQRSNNNRFLIDGFPRNEENRAAFERIVKIEPDLVLFFDCSEEELTRRILNRNQGRVDDNIQTIPKRLKVYFESTLPVIDYYSSKGKVQKIDAERPVDEVYEEVKSVVSNFASEAISC